MRAARAPSGAWTLRLTAGEDAEQEAKTDGNCDGLKRIAPNGLLGLIGCLFRFVLRPVDLFACNPSDGGGEVLQVAADGLNLVGQVLGVAGAYATLGCARTDIAIG